MIIQEPIKAAINLCISNLSYRSAIFLAERLHAEVNSDESFYLLAYAHYCDGKPNIVRSLYQKCNHVKCQEPRCMYLYANACYDLNKPAEANRIFQSGLDMRTGPAEKEKFVEVFGELSSFAALLCGKVNQRLDNIKLCVHFYSIALAINPMLWEAYELMIHVNPAAVDCSKAFNKDSFDTKYSCGTNPLIVLLNKLDSDNEKGTLPLQKSVEQTENRAFQPQQQQNFTTPQQSHSQVQQQQQQPICFNAMNISTPYAVLKQTSDKLDVFTPETNGDWKTTICFAPSKNWSNSDGTPTVATVQATSRNVRKTSNDAALKSVNKNDARIQSTYQPLFIETTPPRHQREVGESDPDRKVNFGILQLAEEVLDPVVLVGNRRTAMTPVAPQLKRQNTRRNIQEAPGDIIGVGSLRRSSRLYSSPLLLNENSTGVGAGNNAGAGNKPKNISRVASRRSRKTINFDARPVGENNIKDDKLAMEPIKPASLKTADKMCKMDLNKAAMRMQLQSAHGMLELIGRIAEAYKELYTYKCKKAIELFKSLPEVHFKTGFVSICMGKAYFEQGKYREACEYYKQTRDAEPYRLRGMEYYSSALWHMQSELELSCLAQELIAFDRTAPETWCASGNCFSLQKEHETSIKFLKRAIQVDPYFAYAYTLLGHELVATDEIENAMNAFRNAYKFDTRHYNALYGIGMIYYRQEKYSFAQDHYRRALEISPDNPVLMCHLAIAHNASKRVPAAIEMLKKASALDPSNALVKFHLSSIYYSIKDYDKAFAELEELKIIAPKESMVYFLIGKIYKELGDMERALSNFSWAMSLDPKGDTNQIKELIDRSHAEDAALVVHNGHNDSSSSSSSGSFVNPSSNGLTMTSSLMDPSGGIANAIASSATNHLSNPRTSGALPDRSIATVDQSMASNRSTNSLSLNESLFFDSVATLAFDIVDSDSTRVTLTRTNGPPVDFTIYDPGNTVVNRANSANQPQEVPETRRMYPASTSFNPASSTPTSARAPTTSNQDSAPSASTQPSSSVAAATSNDLTLGGADGMEAAADATSRSSLEMIESNMAWGNDSLGLSPLQEPQLQAHDPTYESIVLQLVESEDGLVQDPNEPSYMLDQGNEANDIDMADDS